MTNDPSNPDPHDQEPGFRRDWCQAVDELSGRSLNVPLAEESPAAWATANGIEEEIRFEALVRALGIPTIDSLDDWTPSRDYLHELDIAFSRDQSILAFERNENLVAAIGDRAGLQALDLVRRRLGQRMDVVCVSKKTLHAAINRAYEAQNSETQLYIDSIDGNSIRLDATSLDAEEDLLDGTGQGSIVRMVNLILFEAVKARASDIHIQPSQDRVVVRQRIDGILFDAFEIPKSMQEQVLTRIKVLGKMNIAEKRLPQDGRATIHVGDRVIDLRIASLPTSYNERIVIRLLDKSARLYQLGELGMRDEELARFKRLIRLDHGMILVTGPTGSGKSTTLYASLLEVNTVDLNVLSIEDPIEYQLSGVSQTQINEKKGLTFAAGLRSVLRQDPDIIMVGEIRDEDTASMSVQASLTGHLVFSTLHTNDAASSVTRLLDLGIEPYLVSSSLVAVLAQRLVRRICPGCELADTAQASLQRASELGINVGSLRRGAGCEACRGTGYRGRLGIFELLCIDDPIRSLVQGRSNATEIRTSAVESGMRLLQQDGLRKVAQGQTTLDEIVRVSGLNL